jgi:hypothetical protein
MNKDEKAKRSIELQRRLEKKAREGLISGKGEGIGLVTVYQGSGGLSNPEEKKNGKG